MRTDTERLDWLESPAAKDHYAEGGNLVGRAMLHGWRKSIDVSMDAAESAEIEEAWRWFRASGLELKRWDKDPRWWLVPGKEANEITVGGPNAVTSCILAAYRASRKKEGE